jgi:Arc/MetJ family transcription regulator
MDNHMKTTVEIPDALLAEAQRIARRERTTLRALVEEGLRRSLDSRRQRPRFQLRDAAVDGQGLTAEFAGGSWERVRDAIYEGHGT